MDILEINVVEASTWLNDITNKISTSIGIGANNMSISKAEKRLKKLERDYQHTYEKYIETRLNRYRSYVKAKHSNYRSDQAKNCIRYYQDVQEKLKNNLEKLNRAEATQREIEKPLHCKELSKLHGCKSLTKENKILQHIEETQQQQQQQPENNDNVQKRKYFKANWEFNYYRSRIPKSSNSKAIHELLRQVRDPDKSRDETNIAYDYTTTRTRIEMEIKVLTKIIEMIKKEERRRETRDDYDYEEKIRELEKKCEWICGKWDEEKKIILGFKKT